MRMSFLVAEPRGAEPSGAEPSGAAPRRAAKKQKTRADGVRAFKDVRIVNEALRPRVLRSVRSTMWSVGVDFMNSCITCPKCERINTEHQIHDGFWADPDGGLRTRCGMCGHRFIASLTATTLAGTQDTFVWLGKSRTLEEAQRWLDARGPDRLTERLLAHRPWVAWNLVYHYGSYDLEGVLRNEGFSV